MTHSNKIKNGVLAAGLVGLLGGGFTLYFGAIGDFWGSRGVDDLYRFQYHGMPAVVQQDHRILAPDKYWIQLGSDVRINSGTLLSDDDKEVCVGVGCSMYPYTVKDQQPCVERQE